MDQIKIQAIYSKTKSVEISSTLENVDLKANIEWLIYRLKSTFDIDDDTHFKVAVKTMMSIDPKTDCLTTLDKNDGIYQDETERFKTFEGWPTEINWVHPKELAENGLVYTGIKDKARCVFCAATFEEWEDGDTPVGEHTGQSPECPLVKLVSNGSSLKEEWIDLDLSDKEATLEELDFSDNETLRLEQCDIEKGIFGRKTTMDSLEYLPLYRIRGDSITCCNPKCELTLDANVGHFYLTYILKGEKKVGLVFQYKTLSSSSTSLSLSKMPVFKMGSESMTLNIIVNFLTRDELTLLERDYPELKFKLDKSIKRKFAIWWRQQRGFYTGEENHKSDTNQPVELLALEKKQGFGIFCVDCMKKEHPKEFRNAEKQFQGYASFV